MRFFFHFKSPKNFYLPGSVLGSLQRWRKLSQSDFSKGRYEVSYKLYTVHKSENGNLPYESQLNKYW